MVDKVLWLSSKRATFVVTVDEDGVIIKPAPICWQWKGKPIEDLIEQFHIDKVVEL